MAEKRRGGRWGGLNGLTSDQTTELNLAPIETAALGATVGLANNAGAATLVATKAELDATNVLVNEMRAKLALFITRDNARLDRLRDAGVYARLPAQAQLGATTGLANNAAVATLVATKAELDLTDAKINALLAVLRTVQGIPLTGADAIADLGATTGEANNAASATLIATKLELDGTNASINATLAKLRLTIISGVVPANLAANTGLANNAAVATLVATRAEHILARTKWNTILTRLATIGVLEA